MSDACPDKRLPVDDLVRRLRSRDKRLPLAASADLTYRCNFSCVHCFCRIDHGSRRSSDELSYDEWDRILGQAADEGVLFLTLTGGEPLVRDDFRRIWVMAKRRGFLIELFTNGSMITPALVDFFAEWMPRQISVTVYAATEPSYKMITGQDLMHRQVTGALDMLVERGIPIEVKALISLQNIHEFELLRRQSRRYGDIFRWGVELLGCYSEGGCRPDMVRLSAREIVRFELEDQARSDEWRRLLEQWQPASPITGSPFRCAIGQGRFHVDPYGSMRPCMLLEQVSYDLRGGSVRDGWRRAIPDALKRFEYEPGPCQTCELAEICRICPANAILLGCPPGGPAQFYCQLGRERARAYGLKSTAVTG